MRWLTRASVCCLAMFTLAPDASAFVGDTNGPMYISSPEFFSSSGSPSYIWVGDGNEPVDSGNYDPGAGSATSVQVNVSGSVSLTSSLSTPVTYDVGGPVGVNLVWWDGQQNQEKTFQTVTVPSGVPHVKINFSVTISSWDPIGGPILVELVNETPGDYIVIDSNDQWFVTWYAGNCAPGYVNDGTKCIGGVLFGGRDVLAHNDRPDPRPDLTAFDLADSGGANPIPSEAADPCLTADEDYRCDSATGGTALPLSRCATNHTRIPLENGQDCPAGQATCSCNAGDLGSGGVANCRMLLGTDFSSSGGPSSFKPIWADAPLTIFKDTTHADDYHTPSDLCDNPGTGYCVDYVANNETCTINCPNGCKVQGLNSNQPRNELQDPVASDGSLIRPVQGDDNYYVWFAYVPSPSATDWFLNEPQCGTGGCDDESVLMFQFHQDGCIGTSPPLSVSLGRGGSYGQMGLDRNTWYWTLGSIDYPGGAATKLWPTSSTNSTVMTPGAWHQFKLYVKWSSTCNSGQACAEPPVNPDGRIGFWIDGNNVVPTTTAARTMWDWSECTDNPNGLTGPVGEYMRSGFYGDSREHFPATVYLAGYAITTNESAADAVLNGFTP